MVTPSYLLSLALLYICLLFAVAWYADHHAGRGGADESHWLSGPGWRGSIYAMSLAVYCSSWTFYGAVGSAAETPWGHAPIYLGPILMFLFGWPIIERMLAVGAHHRVTSVADYIGARYGKRQLLAVLVTLVATAAVLPYIALQFKALAQAWTTIGGEREMATMGGDTNLLVAIILVVFTILFGARRLDGRERHRGLMTAIAVESLVKLVAFVAVAVLAIWYLAQLPAEARFENARQELGEFSLTADFVARTLISGLAILCLPRQFHVMVVEAQPGTNTRIARWIFPQYLALFMLLVLPISLAGASIFSVSDEISPDIYVQLLPVSLDQPWVTAAAFIGGISAATGMVIVATVALAIMITNEVVAPLYMWANARSPAAVLKLGDSLRRIRQVTIAGILLCAWLVSQQIMHIPWLTRIGFISFLAAAQIAPALLAGLYWRRAHGVGVIVGLLAGLALWFYCGVLPVILPDDSPLLLYGPGGMDWLRPLQLFGLEAQHRLAYATGWSLSLNLGLLVMLSLVLRPSPADARQARLFFGGESELEREQDRDFELSLIRVSQLQALLPPFMERDQLRQMWHQFEDRYQQRLLPGDRAPLFVVNQVESVLARIIGATSAHQAMEQLELTQQLEYADLAGMMTDASRLHTFNRELLQTTVESLVQGVSVVDKELRLVAWNRRYEEMFHYPERFLYVGCPIERVYRYNAERGILGSGERPFEEEVRKRLQWLEQGNAYRLQRTLPDGTVIEIRGNPLPHGGFVSTYIDITDYRDMVAELEETKLELEQKVASGSQTLSEINARLRQENRLRAQVEASLREAHRSKTSFMSATSHDLLQPISAARLFAAALRPRLGNEVEPATQLIFDQIDNSLQRAEQLIAELREISRLDSGKQSPRRTHFPCAEVFEALRQEFQPLAELKGLQLQVHASSAWLFSDQSLVTRILQNLLSNAIKYTRSGRVVLGARRRRACVELQVWDTGPGIPEDQHVRVFQEFERLHQPNQAEEGLGLGLAIVSRYAELLGHPLGLDSTDGRGTMFSLQVAYGTPRARDGTRSVAGHDSGLEGLNLLCLDNDPLVLEGMRQLLQAMGAQVRVASSRAAFLQHFSNGYRPDVVLADYHLDGGDTGLQALLAARMACGDKVPGVIISADDSDVIRERARAVGCRFLPKPVSPTRLRALLVALATEERQAL